MTSHSRSLAYARNSTESDPLRDFAAAKVRLTPPTALSLLAEVLDTIDEAFCVCDRAGRIQHENPSFRQVITRSREVERIRSHVRSLARDAACGAAGTASGNFGGSAPAGRCAEFTIGDVCYRLKASLLRNSGPDHSAGSLLSLEIRQDSIVPEHFRIQHRLTPRETEVVSLLAQGHSNKRIAKLLGVSIHTARHHTARVLAKLQATGRAEVGALLRRLHW